MTSEINILPTYTLNRKPSTPLGTFGQLMDGRGNPLCLTCELPWNDNHPQTSCIPAGTYKVIRHNSPDHPDTWEVMNVPGRSAILIHNGNTKLDSRGCILVGDKFGTVNDYPAVLNSVATMQRLRAILPSDFVLTIN